MQLLHNMSTKSNISTASPSFSVISCSVLIYIHLPPPPPIPSHFPIPKLVEIHKLLIGIWYIPSAALYVAAETSFLFFNSSSVESRGAVPESEKYGKIQIMHSLNQPNIGKAQIFNTFTILVLTISIRKRVFRLLFASLKKSLK